MTLIGIQRFGMIHFRIGIGVQLLTYIIHPITTRMHIHPGFTAATMDIIHIIIMDTGDIGAIIQIPVINIEPTMVTELEIMMD